MRTMPSLVAPYPARPTSMSVNSTEQAQGRKNKPTEVAHRPDTRPETADRAGPGQPSTDLNEAALETELIPRLDLHAPQCSFNRSPVCGADAHHSALVQHVVVLRYIVHPVHANLHGAVGCRYLMGVVPFQIVLDRIPRVSKS